MLHASTQKLIIKLCELTALGDIQWREGRDGAVVFETEGYAVEIEGQPAKLRVLNSDGDALEHVDADVLAAAPWPSGDGSFADHVSTMATQARRLARGTDHAISRILSSLSAPPAARIEAAEEPALSTTGGPESEAAIAAAVADMAVRPDPSPEETPTVAATPAAQPPEHVEPAEPETPSPPPHVKRSTETFGRTRSFAVAGRTHHRPSPEARPVSSLGKITASGLVVPGRPGPAGNEPEAETPPAAAEPDAPQIQAPAMPEDVQTTAPRPTPTPTPPDAYKPWV
jgi:hypothetical protein